MRRKRRMRRKEGVMRRSLCLPWGPVPGLRRVPGALGAGSSSSSSPSSMSSMPSSGRAADTPSSATAAILSLTRCLKTEG